jgi:hypothetical protein
MVMDRATRLAEHKSGALYPKQQPAEIHGIHEVSLARVLSVPT